MEVRMVPPGQRLLLRMLSLLLPLLQKPAVLHRGSSDGLFHVSTPSSLLLHLQKYRELEGKLHQGTTIRKLPKQIKVQIKKTFQRKLCYLYITVIEAVNTAEATQP